MRREGIRFFVIPIAVIAVTLFCTPSLVRAATYVVDSTTDAVDDTLDGVCDDGAGNCTLRAAVQEANADILGGTTDTITVPAGTYTFSITGTGENSSATGDIDFTDSDTTTVNGAGSGTTIVDANDIERIFDIRTSASVSLNDLTATNGTTSASAGGGIYAAPVSTLDLDSVVVSNNIITSTSSESPSNGAGLYFSGTTLTVADSTFSGNSDGGTSGDYVSGGGLATGSGSGSSITIQRSTFSGNTSRYGAGLLINTNSSVTRTISDITVYDNTAYSGGGGIRTSGNGTPITISNAAIYSNAVTAGDGGGIHALSQLQLTNVTINNNTASDTGGGISLFNQTYVDVDIAHATISKNYSDSDDDGTGNGGGIYVEGSNVEATIRGSAIAANYEGDPADQENAIEDDCTANSGILSFDYSYLGDDDLADASTGCATTYDSGTGNVGEVSTGDTNIDSVYYTGALSNYGGNVVVQPVGAEGVTIDAIPEAQCLNAAGAALTEDARGLTRPENSTCDIGAYELDQTDPVISVTSGTDTIECSVDTWSDAGATISDNFDSTVSGVTASGGVTEETIDSYTITYSSSDSDYDGNTASNQTRTVTVQDTTAPTITLSGESTVTLTEGDSYTDAGATASDACDSSVSVSTAGTVDTNTPGTYTLTYSATDDSSNVATQKTRVITVSAQEISNDSEETDTGNADENEENGSDDTETASVRSKGKFVRVYVNGEIVAQKRISKKALKKKYRRMQVKPLYAAYNTVAVLSVYKTKAKLTVFRLTDNNALKKKEVKTFAINKRNRVKLKLQKKKKRIVVNVGKGILQTRQVFRLTKKGRLKLLSQ